MTKTVCWFADPRRQLFLVRVGYSNDLRKRVSVGLACPSKRYHLDSVVLDLILLIDILACYRLTRLITKDSLLQEVRWWILATGPEDTTFPDEMSPTGTRPTASLLAN